MSTVKDGRKRRSDGGLTWFGGLGERGREVSVELMVKVGGVVPQREGAWAEAWPTTALCCATPPRGT